MSAVAALAERTSMRDVATLDAQDLPGRVDGLRRDDAVDDHTLAGVLDVVLDLLGGSLLLVGHPVPSKHLDCGGAPRGFDIRRKMVYHPYQQ